MDFKLEYIQNQSSNILNWYPLKRNYHVLQVGGNYGELTEIFSNQCEKVSVIEDDLMKLSEIQKRYRNKDNVEIFAGNINNTDIKQKYDIITLIDISPKVKLEEVIQKVEKNLNDDGKILIAVDNKFGLRFFSGNPENILGKKFESLIGYNNEKYKIETYTKKTLEELLKKLGYNTRFYYPLPDFRQPNVIFSDEQLPEYNSIDKYYPYHTKDSDIIFNEIDVFREILKTNKDMFAFFANSFLIEASKGPCDKTYKYISFNNLRKEQYRLITKITDEYVEKQVINNKANKHYQNIKENIQILKDNGIKTVDYIYEDKIRSKYIKQENLLNNILTEKLEYGKNEEFYEILDNYIKTIRLNTYKETDYNNTIFKKYGIKIDDENILENMNFIKNGLWDMTFNNCFLINNEFYFYDQEWNEPNLAVEYILYRSIIYTISLRRFISIDKLFDKLSLRQYIDLFERLDNKIQAQIRDDDVWNFYSENHYFNIDETKQEIENSKFRSQAQQNEINNLNIRAKAQQTENDNLKIENIKLQKRIDELQSQMDNTFIKKLKRKLRKNYK